MDGGGAARVTRTPEDVFRDFRGRRAGMIKALTTEVEKFYQQCDPEKENLSLYGFPNETWKVNLPAEEVPPELPEPALGINFARDGMAEKDWLALVAVHSDSWLLAVAFYFSSRFGFDKESRHRCQKLHLRSFHMDAQVFWIWPVNMEVDNSGRIDRRLQSSVTDQCYHYRPFRRRLFNMMNNHPTIYEVVTGTVKKQSKEKNPNSSSKSNKSGSKKRYSEAESRKSPPSMPPYKEEEEEDNMEGPEDCNDEHDNTPCGACGESYGKDEFWICCDLCEQWFHGKCVRITPARAEHIKQYKCPSCSSNKRAKV